MDNIKKWGEEMGPSLIKTKTTNVNVEAQKVDE